IPASHPTCSQQRGCTRRVRDVSGPDGAYSGGGKRMGVGSEPRSPERPYSSWVLLDTPVRSGNSAIPERSTAETVRLLSPHATREHMCLDGKATRCDLRMAENGSSPGIQRDYGRGRQCLPDQ